MFNYIWPLALVIVSNTLYQICAKSVPGKINPFASLTITYLIAALASALLYLVLGGNGNIIEEYRKLNWAPLVLGIVIVGLEGGWIYAYKAGWPVSIGQVVHGALLGIILIFVGALLYKEPITWNKLVGIAICLVGLVFINLK